MARRRVVLTTAFLLVLVQVVAAETEEPLTASPRVRVTAPSFSGRRIVGTAVAFDDAILTLRAQGTKEEIRIPRAAIARLESSRRRSRKRLGAGIGLLAGIGAAAAFQHAAHKTCERAVDRAEWEGLGGFFTCLGAGAAGLLGAIVSIPAGTLIGWAAAPGERWEEAPVDRVRVTLGAGRAEGLRAVLTVRF
jgi:hypothetical protein